jgi:hypothetical protein
MTETLVIEPRRARSHRNPGHSRVVSSKPSRIEPVSIGVDGRL